MLNKKGFTLIELLAAIVILIIVMMIAIPSITASIERSKQNQLSKKIELIENAASVYISDNVNKITKDECYVNISDLESLGLLSAKELEDPTKSNTKITGSIKYTRSPKKFEYFSDINTDTCL